VRFTGKSAILTALLAVGLATMCSAQSVAPLVVSTKKGAVVDVPLPPEAMVTPSENNLTLEVHKVRFPKSATGLRFFIVPSKESSSTSDMKYYIGSISRGQIDPSNPTTSYALELSPALNKLNSTEASRSIAGNKLRIRVEPISGSGETTSDSVEIGRMLISR
jgi:hypothetical protein